MHETVCEWLNLAWEYREAAYTAVTSVLAAWKTLPWLWAALKGFGHGVGRAALWCVTRRKESHYVEAILGGIGRGTLTPAGSVLYDDIRVVPLTSRDALVFRDEVNVTAGLTSSERRLIGKAAAARYRALKAEADDRDAKAAWHLLNDTPRGKL